MTFADKTIVPGRQAASILDLDLDRCARTYGVAPCTASLALQNFLNSSQDYAASIWTKLNVTALAAGWPEITDFTYGGTAADDAEWTLIGAQGVRFNGDGTRIYRGRDSGATDGQLTSSGVYATAYLPTDTAVPIAVLPTGTTDAYYDICWNANGSEAFLTRADTGLIEQRANAGPAFNPGVGDLSSLIDSFALASPATSIDISPDGTRIYLGSNTAFLKEVPLSTAFDLTTAGTLVSTATSLGFSCWTIRVAPDGAKLYVSNTQDIHEFALSTAYDLSSFSDTTREISIIQGSLTNHRGFDVSPDGTALVTGSQWGNNAANNDTFLWTSPGSGYSPPANPLDGALDAVDVLETAITGVHSIAQVTDVEGVDVTLEGALSGYFKPINGRDKIRLQVLNDTDNANYFYADFDLTNGTVTATSDAGDGSFISARLDAIGPDGYYRCVVVGIADTLGGASDGHDCQAIFLNPGTSYLGDVTKGFTVYGMQYRYGLFAGVYAVTTTAAVDGMGTAGDACYNTFGTCQDTPNYLKEVRTLQFVDADVTRPVDLIEAYPSITGVRYGATRIQPGGKFSVRGTVSVKLQDFAHNDNDVDDYVEQRDYDPETQGTFFGKLKERSKYYVGRPMRVLEGYLDAPFSIDNFRTREYIIENIVGPDARGLVTVTGKDILAKARDDRSKAPTASTYTLRAAMTDVQTTLLPQVGEAVLIAAGDKHIRVGDEIMEVTSESPTDTLNVVRAQGGTTGDEAEIDDSVQECLTYEDEPVIDVIDDLLTNFANIPASFIPTTDWETEEGASLTGYDMTTIISAPTGVTKLLQEICAITLIDLWYSDVDQEIKLKLQTPFTDVTTEWTDADNFLMNTVKTKDLNDQRLSRVLIYYGIRNYAEKLTEPENFSIVNFEIEADKEGVNKYDDEKIRTIFSRWFDLSNAVQVALTSQRLLQRFGITPIEVMFEVDAKDVETLQTGDVYDAQTRIIQDVDGSFKTTRFQVVETKPKEIGSKYIYKSLAFFQDPTPDSLTISTNEIDYDVFVELGGPPAAVDVTLTINTTITVDGSTGNSAITTAGMHPDSTLHLINNGLVHGAGGQGGAGADAIAASFYEPEPPGFCFYFGSTLGGGVPGSPGGDAIYTTIDITIDNTNGVIFGGGGGGGGGSARRINNAFYGGGGGGGGLGEGTAPGGALGDATEGDTHASCPVTLNPAAVGTDGTDSANGTGGASPFSGYDGGDGGSDWAVDGDNSENGVAGGAGGFAVRLNGSAVVWEGGNTAAKVKGNVA